MTTATIRNWDGTRTWTPEAVFYPRAEEEICAFLKKAAYSRKRIKPVGEALSWSDISDTPARALRFDKMAEVLEVDIDNRRVRVQAGVHLKDVNEVLARHGLAFDNFGSIVLQTAAGYIGTGAHGTGARTPILSSFIEKMRLIDGLGEIHEITADQETEYAIPIGQAASAIYETRKIVLQADYRVNFPLEVRFVAADDIPLSPANGRNSCHIGAYVGSLERTPAYFADFEDLMRGYKGRRHWCKSFSRTHKELKSLYPAYEAFDRLRRDCDPYDLFGNSFVDRVFPKA